jgi:hypothetical protein
MNKRIDQYIFEYEETNLSSSSYSEDDSDTDLIDEMKTLLVDLSALSLISDNLSNVETFINSFDFVEKVNAEIMITNLVNRSLNHFLINNLHINMNDQTSNDLQTDLKMSHFFDFVQIDLNASILVHICMKNIDSFTYMIIDRYTFAVFYEIMIDSKASLRSIVDYE